MSHLRDRQKDDRKDKNQSKQEIDMGENWYILEK